MKVLKNEHEYKYKDCVKLQCGHCNKKLFEKGQEVINDSRIKCPRCGTVYNFEPTLWRVLSDTPED